MPLIIVTGLPTSGKSHRAAQLHAYLASHLAASPSKPPYRLHLISDESLSIPRSVYDLSATPAHVRSANASEKDARATTYAAVKRVLSDRDIVILDGGNYIKGWRYQLHCEAKAVRTPCALLQVGCSVDRARSVNEARLKAAAAAAAAAEEPSAAETSAAETSAAETSAAETSAAETSAHGDTAGDNAPTTEAYEPANWENLVFRYEEPNPMTRWDSPLFTLIWEDDDAQAKSVFASLWEAVAGEGRKAVKPNQATVQRSRDAGGDYLYVLDRETQDIVRRILEGQGEEGGGTVSVPNGGGARARELTVELPGRKLGVPQMQRHRRAFVGLNRGGIGLEGVGEFTVTRMREGFVGYLNDAFDKEDV
ncbi:Protein kti12 like protein [Verticillium longisporum]|uniref:Protein kti12 like protein n=1 Tax=Verticillium longisporum TaxID=100787 RepID=A0A8I3ANG5_VERLO|nr:Protein kti12 like protein [Verticillium longisporum]RBQ65066.1 hypothetical protein VDGD_06670 [Verticillium dahliae]